LKVSYNFLKAQEARHKVQGRLKVQEPPAKQEPKLEGSFNFETIFNYGLRKKAQRYFIKTFPA